MDAIDAILTRNTVPKLQAPAPSAEEMETLFQCAFRAPDHGRLRPWRFLTIEGAAREKLGELFVAVKKQQGAELSEKEINKLAQNPFRAPMIVVAIAHLQEHPKAPEIEQKLTVGAAVQNMMNGAHAMGYGAMWRTGTLGYSPEVRRGLGLDENEVIVGYIYLGTAEGKLKPLPEHKMSDFVKPWLG